MSEKNQCGCWVCKRDREAAAKIDALFIETPALVVPAPAPQADALLVAAKAVADDWKSWGTDPNSADDATEYMKDSINNLTNIIGDITKKKRKSNRQPITEASPQPDALREAMALLDDAIKRRYYQSAEARNIGEFAVKVRAALTSPKAPVADLWPAEGNQGHSKATGGESNSNSGEKPLDGSAQSGLPEASPQERERLARHLWDAYYTANA